MAEEAPICRTARGVFGLTPHSAVMICKGKANRCMASPRVSSTNHINLSRQTDLEALQNNLQPSEKKKVSYPENGGRKFDRNNGNRPD
jgi:hypothetical protein